MRGWTGAVGMVVVIATGGLAAADRAQAETTGRHYVPTYDLPETRAEVFAFALAWEIAHNASVYESAARALAGAGRDPIREFVVGDVVRLTPQRTRQEAFLAALPYLHEMPVPQRAAVLHAYDVMLQNPLPADEAAWLLAFKANTAEEPSYEIDPMAEVACAQARALIALGLDKTGFSKPQEVATWLFDYWPSRVWPIDESEDDLSVICEVMNTTDASWQTPPVE